MRHGFLQKLLVILLGLLLCSPAPVFADDDDAFDVFAPTTKNEESPVFTSRFPRPTSRVAENVTVITAVDIERLNAHTLADVLRTVPGIQLDYNQTPGGFTFFYLQAMVSRHVLVQIDGIPQNFLSSDNLTELGAIPVQMIERVEIIKGAASAAWGSAMGGVVNIITKSPDTRRAVGGLLSGSVGSRSTVDGRAELSGTVDRLGYYLTAGNLGSDGLTSGTHVRFNHGFGKLTYDLPSRGTITLGMDLRDKHIGLDESPTYDYHDHSESRYASGYLSITYPLADRLTLNLNGYGGRRLLGTTWGAVSVPDLFLDYTTREIYQGANVSLSWGDSERGLTTGLEYEHHDIRHREPVNRDPLTNFDLSMDRWSAHLNGIWTVGRLSILPGFRFDHTNLLDDAYSYTLGVTYQLTDTTTLRAYASRGYGMPVISNLSLLNNIRSNQNVETLQAGFETTAVPYLWLKGTLFYNSIWKVQSFDTSVTPATVTLHDQVRQGAELELRTSPLYGLSLTAGYTFSESWDKKSKAELTTESGLRQNVKVGLNYENSNAGLQSALTGNYLWGNSQPEKNPNLSAMIWNLHLNWKPLPKHDLSPEFFFSIHNLFNGKQYIDDLYPNAPIWGEGGMRVRF